MPDIPVWTVSVDDNPTTAIFNDLDVALDYLRGYLATNGGKTATLQCKRMDSLRYAAEVELEDGARPGDSLISRS